VSIARPRVARFTRAIPPSASAAFHVLHAKILSSKFHHGPKLWVSQNIFAGLFNIGFSKYCDILGKTLYSGPKRRPGRQAHGSTALALRHHVQCPPDFLGLVNTSRKTLCETTSVTWRLLQPFLKRFSRYPIYVPNLDMFTFSTALVQVAI
jgi:hypothetical protein